MARTPTPNDGMTRKELDIGDSDLSLDPVGLLDDPQGDEQEIEVPPEDPAEMLDRCLGDAETAGDEDADGEGTRPVERRDPDQIT